MSMSFEQLLETIESDMGNDIGCEFVAVAARYFAQSRATGRSVSPYSTPDALQALFSGELPAQGEPFGHVLERIERDVVRESNWLYHPRAMGHQVSAPLPAAVWTDVIVSALNQSVAVQEMSPALTMIEHRLIRWLCSAAGFENGSGTFTSGGTEATFTALLAARAATLPHAWEDGLDGKLPVVLCGEHAHYAVTRAVAQLGLGLKRALLIGSVNHRLDVRALAARLQQLRREDVPVMAVVATAGSTATGSFDDLDAIADVCDEHGVWLHVDGAHGATALLSTKHQASLAGIARARSLAWDPHKMMLLPLSAGVLLVRHADDLDRAFRQQAPYLFHQAERNWDQGGRSFQCSRRADALKLWVAVQRYGTAAFGTLYDYFAELARYLYALLDAHNDFTPVHEPECNILCFRYTRGNARSLDEKNLRLRTLYNTRGTGWITTTVLNGQRVLRVTLINPRSTREHLDAMVEELAEIGHDLD
ncbi:MAG TPA: aminotransferase class I/II-fold pyridoxal phosphate-dependent enzyme [Longimicrobiales bacterium]|nr:aminotransferase class I/II-fold pyridoxal phosphate-dependent enzyme [Longimicrobiales bacterium]